MFIKHVFALFTASVQIFLANINQHFEPAKLGKKTFKSEMLFTNQRHKQLSGWHFGNCSSAVYLKSLSLVSSATELSVCSKLQTFDSFELCMTIWIATILVCKGPCLNIEIEKLKKCHHEDINKVENIISRNLIVVIKL